MKFQMLLLALLGVACVQDSLAQSTGNDTIYDTLQQDGNYTKFLRLVDMTTFQYLLDNPYQNVTVFAPTDSAFQRLSPVIWEVLQSEFFMQLTEQILAYHISPYPFVTNDLCGNGTLILPTLLDGLNVWIRRMENASIYVNEALIVEEDVTAVNGVIQGVDAILLPRLDGLIIA